MDAYDAAVETYARMRCTHRDGLPCDRCYAEAKIAQTYAGRDPHTGVIVTVTEAEARRRAEERARLLAEARQRREAAGGR